MENNTNNEELSIKKEEINIMNHNKSELVDNKNSTVKKLQFYIIMILGFIVTILIIYSLFKNIIINYNKKDEVKKIETANVKVLKKEDIPLEKTILFPPAEWKTKEVEDKKEEKIETTDNMFSVTPKEPLFKAKIIKGSTGTLVINNNDLNSKEQNNYKQQIDELVANQQNIKEEDSNKNFTGDTFVPTAAKMNEFNPDLLLPKGSFISCSLDTRFVSAIEGNTSCTVSNNIYSSNGNVLLIEKGSKLFGNFKGGETNDGTSRYLVIWQEVRTPNHLRIPLYSGATDELGASGLEGEIDHKWLMRFGSSIMLSAVDDLFNVLAYKLTNSNNNDDDIDYSENTRDNASNMATIALEKFINIKPTIYKQHGDLIGVYVNRDVDFSKVYKLEKK
ncbi:type IV secretion system protein VirB10 [Arcobacter defluvii]|uniref:P-type type IV conjugative transfer system translocation pore protein TrbI/VirB10 n=1 Tax=Arcobacter defluvii TaxID=873191 RepID=A0AAE7BEK3_9BACT|nr:type IV secretion system protein VirB10 [Arcobacter defluvii]QKF77295.1 P-type type IV conjugative transfer system translocation pore protein TrbI/VirB10 [Arcobacter defluvii]QKF77861.1 P-type type IV conjugative transfer system translocation pore protein TrbI/VirB10 [Arcobacter defluvii]RXI29652.1 type IV secretion system protein VirB10 [Arcobacter defluvii]